MVALSSEVIVGRARELAELERALDATQAETGATVLVAGEAGIGKTRLASEVARRAGAAGFDVLVGRSIDLVGTDLPYQPLVEAFRPLGDPRRLDVGGPTSQLKMFEQTLALLSERAAVVPVLLVLEDLHWADTSTLDLVVFLAHNVDDRRVLLLATYRADEPQSGDRMQQLREAIRRSGSPLLIELGPLDAEAMADLLASHAATPLPPAQVDAIVARSEGNPFFAEELMAAAPRPDSALPTALRDVLLQRVNKLDSPTQSLLRLAAAAGRDVGYPLVRAAAQRSEHTVHESLRRAVEAGVLVPDQSAGTFRFRHALLAEAIYATILPGEREQLHARLADELARNETTTPAELAPHWAVAGRTREALVASVEAARQAQAVVGLAEARAHLERALALWDGVPDAQQLTGLDHAELCSWAADLASLTGAAPRAVALTERAIELVGERDNSRASLLYQRLGRYLFESGSGDTFLAAHERAVAIIPAEPSAERAQALEAFGRGLQVVWRHDESLPLCEQALELARAVGAVEVEAKALTTLGSDLAYVGRADEGLSQLDHALVVAKRIGDPHAIYRVYVSLTDVLMMVGRPRRSVEVGEQGLAALAPFGVDNTVLAANLIEALLAIGDWDQADEASAALLRNTSANYPHMPLGLRAMLEAGRGDFDAARLRLRAARQTIRYEPGLATYSGLLAEVAVWERRWVDADEAAREGMGWARPQWGTQLRVWLSATGLRANAELAAFARARRDAAAERRALGRAETLVSAARLAAAEAAAITPNADGWLAVAEAEYQRACQRPRAELWSHAADTWDRLERPPVVAYCRWRQAEALVAAGASRVEASRPLREAYDIAEPIGARPLLDEVERLAQRARLDLAAPPAPSPAEHAHPEAALGLTAREAEVLDLVARGYTNREIAATLVISTKTASVHVSHILHKLGAPNRREAAAIAHRLAPPPDRRRQRDG